MFQTMTCPHNMQHAGLRDASVRQENMHTKHVHTKMENTGAECKKGLWVRGYIILFPQKSEG